MLWIFICSKFECILNNIIAIKEFPKHILQCTFAVSIFLLHYTDGCIWSIINDWNTESTLLFFWKRTVKDEWVLCNFFENRGTYSTYVYIKTIINYQEDSQSTHFSLSIFNTGSMVNTEHTHSHFPTMSCVCPSLF